MDERELYLEVLAEEDRVLAEALRLARGSGTRAELFAMVDRAGAQSPGR